MSDGHTERAPSDEAAAGNQKADAPKLDFHPLFLDFLEREGLQLEKIKFLPDCEGTSRFRIPSRNQILLTEGNKSAIWQVPTLTGLFRGEKIAPADIEEYPLDYVSDYYFIERRVLQLCESIGDRTDQEMEEVYGALRRRPDGRSLGLTHDFLWQASALLLAQRALSASEYEGIMSGLLRSARNWGMRPVSRNYVDFVRQAQNAAG